MFYGSYILKMIRQRKQGIITDRMGKGKKSKKTFIIEIFLKAITYILAAIQLVSIASNASLIENMICRYIGLSISALGTVIFIDAMATMKNNWRAGVDETQSTNMVTKGIYKISRNPAFLGFDLLYFGLALAFSNIVLILISLLGIIILHYQILEEEKYLQKVFDQEYMKYKKITPRYFLFL